MKLNNGYIPSSALKPILRPKPKPAPVKQEGLAPVTFADLRTLVFWSFVCSALALILFCVLKPETNASRGLFLVAGNFLYPLVWLFQGLKRKV